LNDLNCETDLAKIADFI